MGYDSLSLPDGLRRAAFNWKLNYFLLSGCGNNQSHVRQFVKLQVVFEGGDLHGGFDGVGFQLPVDGELLAAEAGGEWEEVLQAFEGGGDLAGGGGAGKQTGEAKGEQVEAAAVFAFVCGFPKDHGGLRRVPCWQAGLLELFEGARIKAVRCGDDKQTWAAGVVLCNCSD